MKNTEKKNSESKPKKASPRPLVNKMLNHPNGAYSWQKLYDPIICEHIPALYEGGKTNCEVAVAIGICESTFYDWIKQYPAFAEAVKYGKAISKSYMMDAGRGAATTDKKINGLVWHIIMRNCHEFDKDKEGKKQEEETKENIGNDISDLINEH